MFIDKVIVIPNNNRALILMTEYGITKSYSGIMEQRWLLKSPLPKNSIHIITCKERDVISYIPVKIWILESRSLAF